MARNLLRRRPGIALTGLLITDVPVVALIVLALPIGSLRAHSGALPTGLKRVAAVELAALVPILAFVPARHPR